MLFNTEQEAFNYWYGKPIEELEKRAEEIKHLVNTDVNAPIEQLTAEVNGMNQVQLNKQEKRGINNMTNQFNPITKQENTVVEFNENVFDTTEYRSAFIKNLLGKNLSEVETRAMEKAQEVMSLEKRLDPFNTATDNASVIPTETLNEIVRKATTQGGLLAEARAFNIPSNLRVPVGTPLSKANWHVEGAEVAGEKATVTHVEFNANEIIKVFSMSAKAKKMSVPAFENYITDELSRTVLATIEESLVNGNGSEQGKGLTTIEFTAGKNLIEFAEEPTYKDFANAIALLPRGYGKGAKWAMNNATLYSMVYGLVDTTGKPVFIADPKGESIGKILGFDVIVDDNLENGEIYFGNFKYLGYNLPEGIAVEVSTQSSFSRGLIDYRALAIADTQVILPEAFIKLAKSAGTGE